MAMASLTFLLLLGSCYAAGLLWFCVVSIGEREWRAARVSLALALLGSIPLLGAAALPEDMRLVAATVVLGCLLLGLVAFFLPVGRDHLPSGDLSNRVDERDIQFARARLKPGSPEFDAYYRMRPGKQAVDDEVRRLPGLLSNRASLADPEVFLEAQALFAASDALRDKVDGTVAEVPERWSPEVATAELTALAKRAGAVDAGTTALNQNHVYSHIGRGTGVWGDAIDLPHGYAIAFTVEMDHRTMKQAPKAPVVAESGRQYLAAAQIAVEVAAAIRARGYSARAHIDGNYRVIAPLVGRSAGLGGIGRMGILMTHRLGPRVRLGVVTTELPLSTPEQVEETSIIDACTLCRKCADCCPGNAIPAGSRTPADTSGLRWAINSDACFHIWNEIGTDCGRCMAVCPYSHPDSATHNLVRWAMRRSGVARRFLIKLDDLFYGKNR